MSRNRQGDWTDFQKLALADCLARGATLAETIAATGRNERQVKDRINNSGKRIPASWKKPSVNARHSGRSQIDAELNGVPSNPRLALRKFSWEAQG